MPEQRSGPAPPIQLAHSTQGADRFVDCAHRHIFDHTHGFARDPPARNHLRR
jgi:hypothetical protein